MNVLRYDNNAPNTLAWEDFEDGLAQGLEMSAPIPVEMSSNRKGRRCEQI